MIYDDDSDPLGPARGVVNGCLASIIVFLLITGGIALGLWLT